MRRALRNVTCNATLKTRERTYFKKSENRGLHADGSARVGGGCFGTRNNTFMGWLRACERVVHWAQGCGGKSRAALGGHEGRQQLRHFDCTAIVACDV